MKKLLLICLALVAPMLCTQAWANWQLDNEQSYLGFATVKNDLIAENHSFTGLSGSISETGGVSVTVDLKSVETLIPIRNERMQEMLFQVEQFPAMTVSAQVDLDTYTGLGVGEQAGERLMLEISLHGKSLKKTVPVKVVRSSETAFDVTSLGPVVIHASQFALSEGVEKLRQVAGLQSIDLMVPVSFSLRFVDPAASIVEDNEPKRQAYRSISNSAQTGQ